MNIGAISLAVLAAASLPQGGCGSQLFSADVQVNDICKTVDNQQIPAAPAAVAGPQQVSTSFTVPVDDVLSQADYASNSSLKLRSVTLRPTAGISDLSGVTSAEIRVASGGQEVVVTNYQHAAGSGAVTAIALDTHDFEMISYLNGSSLSVSADLAGSLPTSDWTASITACFTASTSLHLPQ
jgi:hypothetical protein